MVTTIISGGQTGADRAAWDVALERGLRIGGWVPSGRLAEDGAIPERYAGLRETESADPAVRTGLNVRDSDATLVISHGPLSGGSLLTFQEAIHRRRPILHLDLALLGQNEAASELQEWLRRVDPRTLNVAGPRAGDDPAIGESVASLLREVLTTMAETTLQTCHQSQHGPVVDVLSEAYLTNPINVAVFGGTRPEQARQNRALFSWMLREMLSGTSLVALHEGAVVGFVHWVSYPGCRPSREKVAAVMPALLAELAPDVVPRLTTWLRAWAKHDPDDPHSHFGPIGVTPRLQGTGIGRLLMQRYCADLDRAGEVGYLETDRPENVGFYGRSGFEVTSEMELLGVRNWFMHRRPRPS